MNSYSKAPFNFVRLPERPVIRYSSIDELPGHDSYRGKNGEELLSGYIEYTLTAETPIIVSGGIEKEKDGYRHARFFENVEGKKAIPGNTIRGMVRSNLQILSFSNILGGVNDKGEYPNSDIQDSRFLFRDVAGNNSLSRKYANTMGIVSGKRIAENVHAGYIMKEGKYYKYIPAKEINNMPYIRIDEIELRKIADPDLEIKYMYTRKLLEYEEKIHELNKIIAEAEDKGKDKEQEDLVEKAKNELNGILNDCKNNGYEPYCVDISFEIDNQNNKIIKVGKRGKYTYSGVILSGGWILGKRSHYIVGEEDSSIAAIKIDDSIIDDYKKDLILTKKEKKTVKSSRDREIEVEKRRDKSEKNDSKEGFYALPERGQKKPFFYINHAGRFHFGFTPYMRLFYRNSVFNYIPETYKAVEGISYSEALFGFIGRLHGGKNVHYKSRLSFEDAVIIGDAQEYSENGIGLVLAAPKPTCYHIYLEQKKNIDKKELNTYEDESNEKNNFKIRGIKQYWLKDRIIVPKEEVKKEKVAVYLHPLKERTKFKGRIYFNNLYADELGLLLWSLRLEDNCYQTIGMAKPFGFGRAKVGDIKLHVEDLNKKYSEFCFDYEKTEDIDKYISSYKQDFSKKYLNGNSIENSKPVEELITIKSQILPIKYCEYMGFNEYRKKGYFPKIIEWIEIIRNEGNDNYKNIKKNIMNDSNDRYKKSTNTMNKNTKGENRREIGSKKPGSLLSIEYDRKDIAEKLEELKKKLQDPDK